MAIGIAAAAVALYLGICIAFARAAVNPKRLSYQQVLENEIRKNNMDPQLMNLPFEKVSCFSGSGERLVGRLYRGDSHASRYVLFFHGYNAPWVSGLKYVPLLYSLGFHVLLVDQPAQGESGGKFITYGAKESAAGSAWLTWLEQKAGSLEQVGVMGESMGAATALLTAAEHKGLLFCIADCPYSSWKEELLYWGRKRYRLPTKLLMPGISFFCRLFTGVDINTVSPQKAASKITCPTLLIHGDRDKVVPLEMAQAIAGENPQIILHIAKGAGHANAIGHAPDKYKKSVESFLQGAGVQLPYKEVILL